MMRPRLAVLLASAVALAAGLAAGPAAWGRLALGVGLPALALPLLDDPGQRGVALFHAGRYPEADDAFRAAGRSATFNRGNSLAATGQYALAIAYYDAVLFADPTDADALANRALLQPLVPPVIGESNEIDGIPATVATPESRAATSAKPVLTLTLAEQASVIRQPDAQGVVASREWLETLADEPGRFLRLRLQAEHERRLEAGLAVPPGDTPW